MAVNAVMPVKRHTRTFAIVLLSILSGCRKSEPARIGVVVGWDGIAGAQAAAADVNAEGGIDGKPLELVVVPYLRATSAAPSLTIADSLTRDPTIIAVVGHSNSAASLAASQIYNARHVPQIAPTSTAPLFSDAGPYSFRLVPDDRHQAQFLANLAARSARRVAVMYVNDDYGRGLRAAMHDDLRALHVDIVSETPYLEEPDDGPFAAAARDVAVSRPDLLLWLGRGPELERFLALLRPRFPHLAILGSDGVDAPVTYGHAGNLAGVKFARFIDPDGGGAEFQRVRARVRAIQHRDIDSEGALSYDAVRLIVAAMRSGARTREAVRDYLAATGRSRPAYVGVTGPIAFDTNGDVVRQHLLAEVVASGVRPAAP